MVEQVIVIVVVYLLVRVEELHVLAGAVRSTVLTAHADVVLQVLPQAGELHRQVVIQGSDDDSPYTLALLRLLPQTVIDGQ